jgi:hypothetical protein
MWAVVACLLLGISGGFRFWREQQFASLVAKIDSPRFSLNELPRAMGDWRSEESLDDRLDPKVALTAGSRDHIVRTYLNEKSGDQISALVIYGLADKVAGHWPDLCYPAAGYQVVQGPVDREIKVPGLKAPVRYRWAIYVKRMAGIGSYQEVYYTFRCNEDWIPNPLDRWKVFRYHPAMFKVQLARPISGLSDEVHAPSEAMLSALIQEISGREGVGAGQATPVSESSAPHSATPQGTGAG